MKKFDILKNLDLIKNFTKLDSNLQRYKLIIQNSVESVNDPENGEHISQLGDLTNLHNLAWIKNKMLQTEEGRLILSEKPRITEETVDFQNLKNYKKDSLGFLYYQYMSQNNFTPNERPIAKYIPDLELSYICQRYKETHDFYHVLLNLDRSLIDEIAVKWFEAEHLKLPSSSLGGLFGFLTLSVGDNFRLYNKLLPGIVMNARNCRFLLGVYFEKRLEENIDSLRKELNISIEKIHII